MYSEFVIGYFDPGSGSLVLQAIVGGSAGLVVFAKYLWDSLPALRRFRRRSK
ncbi:MAG: hypothetical protein ACKV0T_16685 [Planctomycetales bacterium]